jgi:outer membrane protein OmpU
MNKLKKIGLTALAGSLVAGAVNAADMSVTGSAGITLSGGDNRATTGNGFTMGDSLTFSASGDVNDIGITLSYELDGQGAATDTFDDHSITMDFGDAGTLVFAGHGGSSAMSARDDILPTAKEEPWDVVTGADADIINGHSGENMFTYTYDHDSGFKFVGAYLNASDAQSDTSYSDFGIEYTGIEGLRLVYAAGDVESVTNTKTDETTIAGTYAMGAITLGVQVSESDSNVANGDTESTGVGISYQVNEDLAVSYGAHTIEYATGSDQESTAVGFSYTMGSMSISGTMNSVDNIANAAANDREAYEFGVSFSF